jgi:hypothetical protein
MMKCVGGVCITSPLTATERRRLSRWVDRTDPETWPTGHDLARRLMVVIGRPFEYVLETGR